MQSFLPPEEISSIYALLAIIADPKSAKDRLDKIVAEKSAAKKFLDESVALSKKASADKEDAAIMMVDAKKVSALHDARQAGLDAKAKEHAECEARLREKEAVLHKRDSDLANRMKAHDDAVAAHEDDVKAAKADLAAKIIEMKKTRDELDRKTEEFNRLMAPVKAAASLASA